MTFTTKRLVLALGAMFFLLALASAGLAYHGQVTVEQCSAACGTRGMLSFQGGECRCSTGSFTLSGDTGSGLYFNSGIIAPSWTDKAGQAHNSTATNSYAPLNGAAPTGTGYVTAVSGKLP